jgi:hypothetical protein
LSRSGIRLTTNKTRFFNILGEIDDSGCTVLLHSRRPDKARKHRKIPALRRQMRHQAADFAESRW